MRASACHCQCHQPLRPLKSLQSSIATKNPQITITKVFSLICQTLISKLFYSLVDPHIRRTLSLLPPRTRQKHPLRSLTNAFLSCFKVSVFFLSLCLCKMGLFSLSCLLLPIFLSLSPALSTNSEGTHSLARHHAFALKFAI